MILVLVAGIILSISLAANFGPACFIAPVLMVAIIVILLILSNRLQKPYNERAMTKVANIEARYNLSKDESFELLCSDQAVAGLSNFKAFAVAAWGDSVQERLVKQASVETELQIKAERELAGETVPSVKFACNECGVFLDIKKAGQNINCPQCKIPLYIPLKLPCPKCDSTNTVFKEGGDFSWTGAIVGGLLFGGLGAAIGSHAGNKSGSYHCKKCSHNWALNLKQVKPPSPLTPALACVPEELARKSLVFPLSKENGVLRLLATSSGRDAQQKMEFIFNCKVDLQTASADQIIELINKYYKGE